MTEGAGRCLEEGRRRRFIEGVIMDIEKYTERSKGFIQAAQTLALRRGNQQFTPEHLLKVLLDDEEGLWRPI